MIRFMDMSFIRSFEMRGEFLLRVEFSVGGVYWYFGFDRDKFLEIDSGSYFSKFVRNSYTCINVSKSNFDNQLVLEF